MNCTCESLTVHEKVSGTVAVFVFGIFWLHSVEQSADMSSIFIHITKKTPNMWEEEQKYFLA